VIGRQLSAGTKAYDQTAQHSRAAAAQQPQEKPLWRWETTVLRDTTFDLLYHSLLSRELKSDNTNNFLPSFPPPLSPVQPIICGRRIAS